MDTAAPTPRTLSDFELLRLASTPRKQLFSTLNRAAGFSPLILVCCIFPAFQLLNSPGLDEEASLWGLRSLAVANSSSLQTTLQPGLNEAGKPLIFQPPLAAWLNGFVIRLLGPSHSLSSSLVSLAATGMAIWVASRCAWRIGGAKTALIAALLMCSHPLVLESAIVPTNSALVICLMLTSLFSFQRHLERHERSFSFSLLLAGACWGLSLLALGPIAFVLPAVFILHALQAGATIAASPVSSGNGESSADRNWSVMRSAFTALFTGLIIGGWWPVMMLTQYGFVFFRSWWSSLPLECLMQAGMEWRTDLRPVFQQSYQTWVGQTALLLGWLVVGLIRCWRESRQQNSNTGGGKYQLLGIWWLVTFCGRIYAGLMGTVIVTNTAAWSLTLVAPTILLSSVGIGSLIERELSRRGEMTLLIVVMGSSVAYLTDSWKLGATAAILAFLLLAYIPRMICSAVDGRPVGCDAGWRSALKVLVYTSLAVSIFAGFALRRPLSADEKRLSVLKDELENIPEVTRISLIASRDPIPVELRYLLRCRWPHAEIVTTEGWDTGLTEAMDAEERSPHSRFLVLEWTRRDLRISANTSPAWQASSIGNPMQFYGRRLALILIGPKA